MKAEGERMKGEDIMKEKEKEKRSFPGEVRALDAEGTMTIEGYAAVFNQEEQLWEGRSEVLRPGAFKRSLDHGADVRALFNHDPNMPLGRTKNKTLELEEDKKGLRYRVKINAEDPQAVAVYKRIKRGDVDQSSFSFEIDQERFEGRDDGGILRVIESVKLYDVSPCTFPAYGDTEAVARTAFRNRTDGTDETDRKMKKKDKGEGDGDSPGQGSHLSTAKRRQQLAELEIKM